MDEERVVQLVEKYLRTHPLRNASIEVVKQGLRQDGKWWYVPVRPDRELPRTYEYYEVLTEIEDEIKQEMNGEVDVLLVPCS
ncbi:MAG: hypothetical protein HY318_08655 [Armatimonadetes bacterium]|nr:hypothetical protein [Armatimonadota bacterium]